MLTLIRNGGFPMFFIVIFGAIGLATSAWYAYRPNGRSYAFIIWMGSTTFFATLLGLAADIGATCYHVAVAAVQSEPLWHAHLVEGLAESMSPPIMGFALLAMMSLLTAVGRVRDPHAT
jgi:hypothetical protein